MRVGSVEYAVIAFPGNKFKGEIVPAIAELVEQGLVRVLDLVFVQKDAAGLVQVIETSALSPDEAAPFSALASRSLGLLNDEDIEDIADSLPNESSAGLLVWENVWSARFSEAVANADGILIANERIPAAVVKAALEYAGEDVD
jgi:hypothetical protein